MTEATSVYLRAERRPDFRRCNDSGLITHWGSAESTKEAVGASARLMSAEARPGAHLFRGM